MFIEPLLCTKPVQTPGLTVNYTEKALVFTHAVFVLGRQIVKKANSVLENAVPRCSLGTLVGERRLPTKAWGKTLPSRCRRS